MLRDREQLLINNSTGDHVQEFIDSRVAQSQTSEFDGKECDSIIEFDKWQSPYKWTSRIDPLKVHHRLPI